MHSQSISQTVRMCVEFLFMEFLKVSGTFCRSGSVKYIQCICFWHERRASYGGDRIQCSYHYIKSQVVVLRSHLPEN